jgi:Transmembrane domain of unknown function (DUF3566)
LSLSDPLPPPPVDTVDRPRVQRPLPPQPVSTGFRAKPAGPRTSRVVLRRVDPWAVLKVSALFWFSIVLILLTAGVLLWAAAASVGLVSGIEDAMAGLGFEDYEFLPGKILRGAALVGLVISVAGTFGNVLLAVLYNLISDTVGGLRLTLSEDAPTTTRI